MDSIVFSHGNGFPASTYSVLFEGLRGRGFTLHAVEKFGHDPAYPVTDNWPHLVRQLADFAAPIAAEADRVWLVGHSLGGFLSLMAAALHPKLAAGVVLLDSPLVGGWRAGALRVVKRTPLMQRISPGAVSRRRRMAWTDRTAVLQHFRAKPVFAAWDPRVLADYVEHGTVEVGSEDADTGAARETRPARTLSFDREVETRIYDTLPHHLGGLLRRHPLSCPVAFIGGRQSAELRRSGLALTRRITQGRIELIDGSHLFPMERPDATAAAVEAAIRRVDSSDPPPGTRVHRGMSAPRRPTCTSRATSMSSATCSWAVT